MERTIQSKMGTISSLSLLAALIGIFASGDSMGSGKRKVPAPAKQVVVISIDSFRPDFYLSKGYPTATLKMLASTGAYSEGTESVFPSVTYPNHTSLITGVLPNKHGVLSNSIFNWQDGPTPAWYWEADLIQSPPLWALLKQRGMETASVRWPVTVAADVTYLIPEIFPKSPYYEGSMWDLTRELTDPKLFEEVVAATELEPFKNGIEADIFTAHSAAYLAATYRPSLTLAHIIEVDHAQHGHGREGAEVDEALQFADNQVKHILKSIDLESTCVLIVGDHGFQNYNKKVNVNAMFAQRGWLRSKQDWDVIGHKSGGQAAIYVKNRKMIPQVGKFLENHEHYGYELWDQRKLKKMGAYPEADFAISARPGYSIGSSLKKPTETMSRSLGQHGSDPSTAQMKTGFIASGCGIEADQNLGQIHITDIAPTVLNLLGISAPKNMDGKALKISR